MLLLLYYHRPSLLQLVITTTSKAQLITADLVAHKAVKDKDKKSLQAVESREDVSHEERLRIDVEKSKQPGETQQYDQYTRAFQPHPTQHASNKGLATFTLFMRPSE